MCAKVETLTRVKNGICRRVYPGGSSVVAATLIQPTHVTASRLCAPGRPLSPLLFLSYFSESVVRAMPLKVSSSWADGAVTEPPARPFAQALENPCTTSASSRGRSTAFNFSQQSPLRLMQLRSPCSLSSHAPHPLNSLDIREEDQLAR